MFDGLLLLNWSVRIDATSVTYCQSTHTAWSVDAPAQLSKSVCDLRFLTLRRTMAIPMRPDPISRNVVGSGTSGGPAAAVLQRKLSTKVYVPPLAVCSVRSTLGIVVSEVTPKNTRVGWLEVRTVYA